VVTFGDFFFKVIWNFEAAGGVVWQSLSLPMYESLHAATFAQSPSKQSMNPSPSLSTPSLQLDSWEKATKLKLRRIANSQTFFMGLSWVMNPAFGGYGFNK
jgi:hypothetical protein